MRGAVERGRSGFFARPWIYAFRASAHTCSKPVKTDVAIDEDRAFDQHAVCCQHLDGLGIVGVRRKQS